MGHYNSNGVQYFYPDETEDVFYCEYGHSIQELMDLAAKKWPTTFLSDISITAEYIHTACIGYDLYDPSDYTCFLRVERRA